MTIVYKLLKWLPVNLAGVLGIIQAVIKVLKELLTVVVNILFPLIPSSKFQKIVTMVRDWVNKIDAWIESIKGFFLRVVA